MYFKIRKFTSQNLVYQAAVFCVKNAPKVTYESLRFEKIFRGLYPRTPVKKGRELGHEEGIKEGWGGKGEDRGRGRGRERKEGRGGEGRGGEGRGGEGREEIGAPSLQARAPCFPWAGYGPGALLTRCTISGSIVGLHAKRCQNFSIQHFVKKRDVVVQFIANPCFLKRRRYK
jgi:hypothetical protein